MSVSVRTKQYIADTFESLIKEQSFDDITVQDIVKKCDISRSTFYRHFTDKFDVMM